MKLSKLLSEYREAINPPYSFRKRDVVAVSVTFFLLLTVPVISLLSQQSREPVGKAAETITVTGTSSTTAVKFLSKFTPSAGSAWDAAGCSSNPSCSFIQLMNNSFEAIMTFACGSSCERYGNAFNGITYVYQDPTMIRTNCTSDSPGVDCADILLTTSGDRCWQQYFNGSRYLADVTQSDVRDEIVARAKTLVASSAYDGIYIDVAEAWLPNAEDCPGTPSVSNSAWITAWAILAERLQNEVDGPLLLNSQYYTWNSLKSTNQNDANRFWAAPDQVEMEFGWTFGRHGENGINGWNDKINYINHLHGLGTGVFDQEYPGNENDMTVAQEKYGLAMYMLTMNQSDYYGTFSKDGRGSAYWTGYDFDPGAPNGNYYTWNGLQRRDFAGGFVLVNNPGGGTVTTNLGGTFTSLWNETVSSVTLAENSGIVFRGSTVPVDPDTDGDGYKDSVEDYLGTNKNRKCAQTRPANDESVDSFPPDFNDDQYVSLADVVMVGNSYQKSTGQAGFNKRFDLNGDGSVNDSDLNMMQLTYNKKCQI